MKQEPLTKACAVLITLCCLVLLAALGAILFLDVPAWPTALAALFVVLLLARRLFALLSTPESNEPRSPDNFPLEEGLLRHDHHRH